MRSWTGLRPGADLKVGPYKIHEAKIHEVKIRDATIHGARIHDTTIYKVTINKAGPYRVCRVSKVGPQVGSFKGCRCAAWL